MTSTDAEKLAAIRATADYQDFLSEILGSSTEQVTEARQEVNNAERRRRVQAAIAVRGGYGKTATANALGISRPTLDAWLASVTGTTDEMAEVEQHEAFVVRHEAKLTVR